MAKGNKYICATCGEEFTYCPSCELTKPSFDATMFCSKSHAEIFAILSKHGCGLATDKETLKALKPYKTDGLSKNVQEHINALQPKLVESIAKVSTKATEEVVSHEDLTQE